MWRSRRSSAVRKRTCLQWAGRVGRERMVGGGSREQRSRQCSIPQSFPCGPWAELCRAVTAYAARVTAELRPSTDNEAPTATSPAPRDCDGLRVVCYGIGSFSERGSAGRGPSLQQLCALVELLALPCCRSSDVHVYDPAFSPVRTPLGTLHRCR